MAVDKKSKQQLACKVIEFKHKEADAELPASHSIDNSGLAKKQWQKKRKRHDTETAEYLQKIKREFDILKDLKHVKWSAMACQIRSLTKNRPTSSPSSELSSQHLPCKAHAHRSGLALANLARSYIFQELVRGGDLFSYVTYYSDQVVNGEPIGHLPEASAAIVAYQIVKAVAYLHSEGVLHRDLKPDNVLMSSLSHGARVVLTDFGAAIKLPDSDSGAQAKQQQLTRVMSLVGTEDYFAP